MPKPKVKEVSTLSSAVKKTWLDPKVRAARGLRYKILVNGNNYDSVRKAFSALGLPDSKHIKFRGELVASRAKTFEFAGKSYGFEIIETPENAPLS